MRFSFIFGIFANATVDYFFVLYPLIHCPTLSTTSVDSTAQTGHPGAGDLQEELYQMIKSLKDHYFVELNDLYNKISMKIQHIDNHMPAQKSTEQYEKMKSFKVLLERILHFLQVNKSSIQPGFREKIPIYERQILSILRKPVQAPPGQQTFQQPGGQAPSSNISQQHQTSQVLQQHDSHTNQMPQSSLSSMNTGVQTSGAPGIQHVPAPQATNFGVPTQQNVTNAPQAGSNLENAQGNNFNPVQHGSMGTALQQGSTGPMQGALNAQQQSSNNMISNNAMSTMQTNTNPMQAQGINLLLLISWTIMIKCYLMVCKVMHMDCKWLYTAINFHGGVMVPAGGSSKGKKQKKLRCHFCKKGGHFKKGCLKRKIWFEKKGVAYDPTHERTKAHGNKNEGPVFKE